MIDELGYLDIGKEGADLLFRQLVNRRYALERSTIVTTNVPVGRWGDVLGSNVTASAVADRLCHHCAMIKMTGRSYRLKDVSIGGEGGKEDGASDAESGASALADPRRIRVGAIERECVGENGEEFIDTNIEYPPDVDPELGVPVLRAQLDARQYS